MKDKRRINEVWEATNRNGETFVYARVGSHKNLVVVTLHYGVMTKADKDRIGEIYYK